MYVLTGRQWVYQTCAEFGFYQSTDSPNQPFAGFPLVWVHQTWPVKLTHLIAYSVVILIFLFLPIQIFSETVYKLLQHQCWAGGGGCHTDQWVLRRLWHPLKQNCVPQWLHWPLACLGGHSGHLSWPTCDFHQRWTKMMHNEFLC